MILLHGLLGSSRNWQTTGRDLAAQYHVVALDARNHGRSDHADQMGYDVLAGDLCTWMDAQSLAKVILVGHSMGGKTAMLFACRHPARVERLVVVDIAPVDYLWPAHRAEFAAMLELNLATLQSRAEAEHHFADRVADPGMRKFLATNLERDGNGRWRWLINLPVLTEALADLEKKPLRIEDRFDGPALFIAGGKSRYVLATDHSKIRQHFPAARIETIPDCGHNPHMEKRDEFVRLVLN